MIYTNEDDLYHRVNEPAYESSDYSIWFYNGERHRYYGPAWKVDVNCEYWIFGKQIK